MQLELHDEMTLQSICEVHGLVSDALAGHDAVRLDLTKVTECDLSFVQLVEAARKTAARAGKALTLTAPASGHLLQVLHRGGFVGEPSQARSAFWLGTAEAD